MARNNSKARKEQRKAVALANEELRQKWGVNTVENARALEAQSRGITGDFGTQDDWELT